MVRGLGIDVVNIARIKALSPGVRQRLFHPDELAEAQSMDEQAGCHYLAGRFAAKEALGKALGCGLASLVPQRVLVARAEGGAPAFVLEQPASGLVAGYDILLSISHDDPVAVAVVVLSGGPDGPQ
ncbi:MAG: holo-ACP synthase [Sphaerochaeta sp.]|jgi:holo-[acyl-carrier protein] synthase|nr:holo-ACP synthase [Sphaerochaeta sp.]